MRRKIGGLTAVVVALAVACVAGLSAGTSQATPQKGKTITLWDFFIRAQPCRPGVGEEDREQGRQPG
jgi:hypothetical protein